MIPTSNDLPPEVVLGMKLEGIFMPHARKQLDDLSANGYRRGRTVCRGHQEGFT
jgi:hypothetical protein